MEESGKNVVWHAFDDLNISNSGEIRATVRVDQEAPWFSGHFPGNPALPGIAQLAMIWNLLEKSVPYGIRPLEIRKTKFMKIIRPGDPLMISIRPSSKDTGIYHFEIRAQGEISCKGMFRTMVVIEALENS